MAVIRMPWPVGVEASWFECLIGGEVSFPSFYENMDVTGVVVDVRECYAPRHIELTLRDQL
jgi:hypothetical protein